MTIASIEPLLNVLRCPICHHGLGPGLPPRCQNSGCDRFTGFQSAGGQPVLIDFRHSIFTSDIFSAGSGQVLPRDMTGTGIGRFLFRLTYGRNPTSARNASRFSALLRDYSTRPRLLVIGGGSIGEGLESIYRDPRIELVGTDVYASDNTTLVCDAHELPFADESFDGVIIQAVLEHVLDPARVAAEIHRVLRPGGLLYADTPFMQQVHEGAYDFTRFTMSGHRWLFRKFVELDSGVVGGPGIALLWSIRYFLRSLGLGPKLVAVLTAAFFWLRLLDRFADPNLAADAASGLYFLGTKGGRELSPNEMPRLFHRRVQPAG